MCKRLSARWCDPAERSASSAAGCGKCACSRRCASLSSGSSELRGELPTVGVARFRQCPAFLSSSAGIRRLRTSRSSTVAASRRHPLLVLRCTFLRRRSSVRWRARRPRGTMARARIFAFGVSPSPTHACAPAAGRRFIRARLRLGSPSPVRLLLRAPSQCAHS